MKIIACNVNGLRSLLKKKYLNDLIENEDPDIFCMGETKLSCPYDEIDSEIKKLFPKFKYRYWSSCSTQNGYSGTSIFSKKKPLSYSYGIEWKGKSLDWEGRVITLEFGKYYLVHVYTPNSGRELKRLEFRIQEWDRAFEAYIVKLQKTKKVIVCGDLNVAREPIDLKNPKTNTKTAGFTKEERESFEKLMDEANLVDTYRYLEPEKIEYSYWSYRFNSRKKNTGWRIDYFLIGEKYIKKIKKSLILTEILGSDHAPIKLVLNI